MQKLYRKVIKYCRWELMDTDPIKANKIITYCKSKLKEPYNYEKEQQLLFRYS